MNSVTKSTFIGVLMVLVSAVIITTGIIVGIVTSPILGFGIAIGGTIPWGGACFGKPRFYEHQQAN